ncbi:MAG: protein-disulfide isomerase [Thermoproteus sp. JCHS_4]|jgi:hypothetical protein|nr:MAG: protein-disulfide isomerase [Thermoproteus sp. JCHS_4]
MKVLLVAVVAVAVAVTGGVLAYFLIPRGGGPQGPGIAYFCAGFSPAPLQAIQLVESGRLQSSIAYQGQTLCVGTRLSQQQIQYLRNLTSASPAVGSSDAQVVVLEYLDPTCPYCALFDAQYGAVLDQYIRNGTVLYAVRYFPTHVLGYLQQGQPQQFDAGVRTWLGLMCIYNRNGSAAFSESLRAVYAIAASYIVNYLRTGNATALDVYPLREISYIGSAYPQCAVNASSSQLVETAQSAINAVSAEAKALGIPNDMLGTPLFVIYGG